MMISAVDHLRLQARNQLRIDLCLEVIVGIYGNRHLVSGACLVLPRASLNYIYIHTSVIGIGNSIAYTQ